MLAGTNSSRAQNCGGLNIQWKADIASPSCTNMVITMIHDAADRPFLYVANKEAGLKIYDITNTAGPALVATVPTAQFFTLDVMNLSQNGNYLYLALGNSFTNPQAAGMAIVDVSTPTAPVVTDYYVVPNSGSGGGIVKAEGSYAYLGAMQSGLVILDVSNKSNIQFVSQFTPSIAYPPVQNPNSQLYNARGMEVKSGIVYLCYDAGGIRIVNCTNASSPKETGRWCNPLMYSPVNHAKAYNNCVLDGNRLYVAVDYAGVEVLDVSDTSHITMTGWWNPNNAPNANWFNCRIHTNEIQYEKSCGRIFVSDGKSDMHVLDVTNPAQPDSCDYYGGVSNNLGTWGIGRWQSQLYLSYICAVIPFSSNWTGVKILTYDACAASTGVTERRSRMEVFPNPASTQIELLLENPVSDAAITIADPLGRKVFEMAHVAGGRVSVARGDLQAGLYFVRLSEKGRLIANVSLVIAD